MQIENVQNKLGACQPQVQGNIVSVAKVEQNLKSELCWKATWRRLFLHTEGHGFNSRRENRVQVFGSRSQNHFDRKWSRESVRGLSFQLEVTDWIWVMHLFVFRLLISTERQCFFILGVDNQALAQINTPTSSFLSVREENQNFLL